VAFFIELSKHWTLFVNKQLAASVPSFTNYKVICTPALVKAPEG